MKVSPNNRKMDKTTVLKTSIGFLRQHNEMSIRSQVTANVIFVVVISNLDMLQGDKNSPVFLFCRPKRSKQTGSRCFFQMKNSGWHDISLWVFGTSLFFSRNLCLCATALEGAGVDTKLLTDKFCGVEEPLLKKEYIFAFVACAYNAHNFLHNCA